MDAPVCQQGAEGLAKEVGIFEEEEETEVEHQREGDEGLF